MAGNARDAIRITWPPAASIASHLLGIGGDQPRLVADLAGTLLVGAGAAGDAGLHRMRLRLAHRALDQLLGGRPVDPHAALRGVHRLGEAEPLVPEPAAKAESVLPVDRRLAHPGVALGDRVGHDVRGGEGGAGQRHPRGAGSQRVAARGIGLEGSGVGGQAHGRPHRLWSARIMSAAFSPIMIVGRVGVGRDDRRHDRGVDDPERLDPVEAQPRIDDRVRIGAHAAGAGGRGARSWSLADEGDVLRVGADLRPRQPLGRERKA